MKLNTQLGMTLNSRKRPSLWSSSKTSSSDSGVCTDAFARDCASSFFLVDMSQDWIEKTAGVFRKTPMNYSRLFEHVKRRSISLGNCPESEEPLGKNRSMEMFNRNTVKRKITSLSYIERYCVLPIAEGARAYRKSVRLGRTVKQRLFSLSLTARSRLNEIYTHHESIKKHRRQITTASVSR